MEIKIGGASRKTATLIAGQAIGLLALIALQAMIKTVLGLDSLGDFAFLVGIYTLTALFFDWGIGPATAKKMAHSQSIEEEASWATSMLRMLIVPLFSYVIAATAAVGLASFVVGSRIIAPGMIGAILACGFPLQLTLKDALGGQQDVRGLAYLWGLGSLIGLVSIWLLVLVGKLSLLTAIMSYAAGVTIASCVSLFRLHAFRPVDRAALTSLREATAAFGRDIWIGRVVGTGGFILDIPLLGLFGSAASVADYTIIKTLCNPFAVVATNLNIVLFKSMARSVAIHRSIQILFLCSAIVVGLTVAMLVPPMIEITYGIDATPLLWLIRIQAGAVAAAILYGIYNTFLTAKGLGKKLLKGGITFGIVSLTLNFTLIPLFSALGACLVNLVANWFWLIYCFCVYRTHVAVLNTN